MNVPLGSKASLNAPGAERTTVLLLGDSTVITSYLPYEQQYHRVLERELKGFQADVKIVNAADNGEFIARFLLSGAYERMRVACPAADIIVVRFGANDEKRMDAKEYGAQLEKLLALLNEDFPGAKIFLETGIYMDPGHYSSDRNKTLEPYWRETREIAIRHGLKLCDVYAAMEKATAGGNWDLRIRKKEGGGSRVFDASQDTGRENDREWFSDIHPNAEGVRVAVRELTLSLRAAFPEGFPQGHTDWPRPARLGEYYSELLDFPPERLPAISNPPWRTFGIAPSDDFQKPMLSGNQTHDAHL